MMQKYHAKKVKTDGFTFDSQKEAKRYLELLFLEKAGKISGLKVHPEYVLLPPQWILGELAERGVKYIGDFEYMMDGETVVEDVKGVKTPEYILKRKMMLYFHGIQISEV